MRVSKEQAAENRERILEAASRLMRERGISGVGVDALTEAAGMTHGSLEGDRVRVDFIEKWSAIKPRAC